MPHEELKARIDDPNQWMMGEVAGAPKGALMGLMKVLKGAQPAAKMPLHPLAPVDQKVMEIMDEVLPTPKVPEAWEGLKRIKSLFGY